jgi:hypothetical protein
MRDVEELLQHIQVIIDAILEERRVSCILRVSQAPSLPGIVYILQLSFYCEYFFHHCILCSVQKSAISDEAFDNLIEQLKESDAGNQLDLIKAAVDTNTFTSDQVREVLDVLSTTFDKVRRRNVHVAYAFVLQSPKGSQ